MERREAKEKIKVLSRVIIVAGAWKMKKKKNLVVIRLCFQDKKKRGKNEAKITMQIIIIFLSNYFWQIWCRGFCHGDWLFFFFFFIIINVLANKNRKKAHLNLSIPFFLMEGFCFFRFDLLFKLFSWKNIKLIFQVFFNNFDCWCNKNLYEKT